jgi:hypothetical protein
VSPGSTTPGVPRSTRSATVFVAYRSGKLPTTSRVGSFGVEVSGSSDG